MFALVVLASEHKPQLQTRKQLIGCLNLHMTLPVLNCPSDSFAVVVAATEQTPPILGSRAEAVADAVSECVRCLNDLDRS